MRPMGVTTLTPNQVRGTSQKFVARQKSPISGQTVKLVHGSGGTPQLMGMSNSGVQHKITGAVSILFNITDTVIACICEASLQNH